MTVLARLPSLIFETLVTAIVPRQVDEPCGQVSRSSIRPPRVAVSRVELIRPAGGFTTGVGAGVAVGTGVAAGGAGLAVGCGSGLAVAVGVGVGVFTGGCWLLTALANTGRAGLASIA